MICLAGAINLFMAAFFAFAAWLHSDASWNLGSEFQRVLAPVWRIVVTSIPAEVAGELADTEACHFWVTRVTRKYQWSRVLASLPAIYLVREKR